MVPLLMGLILVGGFFYLRAALARPHQGTAALVAVTINPGQSVSEIAESLSKAELINSPGLFILYVKIKKLAPTLQAGEYILPQNLSLSDLVYRLQHGSFDRKLTFPEGWRREEAVAYLKEKMGAEFSDAFLSETVGKEGQLFPDTYFVSLIQTTAKDLVAKMNTNFEERVSSDIKAGFAKQELSLEEGLTMASIVEREAREDEDRPIVAGILLKRYQKGMALEADATVQYAVGSEARGWWPKEITADDLASDSPFNTRKLAGLPPAPICSPGLAAISAVAFPKETPYWYYVSDSKGRMFYAETLDEHNENISKAL